MIDFSIEHAKFHASRFIRLYLCDVYRKRGPHQHENSVLRVISEQISSGKSYVSLLAYF